MMIGYITKSGLVIPGPSDGSLPPEAYLGKQGETYKPPQRRGRTTVRCLPELVGMRWGYPALKLVHGLRPSKIRVSSGAVTTDACLWRVTVIVNDGGLITDISQEVETGLADWQDGNGDPS